MSTSPAPADRLSSAAMALAENLTGGLAAFARDDAEKHAVGPINPHTYESVLSALGRAYVATAIGVAETFDHAASAGLEAEALASAIDQKVPGDLSHASSLHSDLIGAGASAESDAVTFHAGDLAESIESAARRSTRDAVHEFIKQIRRERAELAGLEKFYGARAVAAPSGTTPPTRGFAGIGRKLVAIGAIAGVALGFGVAPAHADHHHRWQTFAAGVAVGAVAATAPRVYNNTVPNYGYTNSNYQTYQPYQQQQFQTNPIYAPAYNGYQQHAYAAPPSRQILAVAKAVEAATIGNYGFASSKVDNVAMLGAHCANQLSMRCESNFDGIHMDFHRGVYSVSVRGITMAVERNGVFAAVQPGMISQAFGQARQMQAQEMQASGAYAPQYDVPRY